MYTDILKFLKNPEQPGEGYLEREVTIKDVQVDFYGNLINVDLRVPVIGIEPRVDEKKRDNFRWDESEFSIRFHVWVAFSTDYFSAFQKCQDILSGNHIDKNSLIPAIKKMRDDSTFQELSGEMSGKTWRVSGINIGRTNFAVQQTRASQKVQTATLDVVFKSQVEV